MEELLLSVNIDNQKKIELTKEQGLSLFVPTSMSFKMEFVGLKIEYGFLWHSECEKFPLNQIEQYISVDQSTTGMNIFIKPTFFQENGNKFERTFIKKTKVRITFILENRKKEN